MAPIALRCRIAGFRVSGLRYKGLGNFGVRVLILFRRELKGN